MILSVIVQIFIGSCAGGFTAAGLFAVINSIGVLNRIAYVTGIQNRTNLLENMVVIGAVIGNIWWIFDISVFRSASQTCLIAAIIISVFSGMYIGLFLVCLAEAMKALPLFLRKIRISKVIGLLILSIAVGKCVGELFYFLVLYK